MKPESRPKPRFKKLSKKEAKTNAPLDSFTHLLARYRRQVYECYSIGSPLPPPDATV